MRIGIKTSAVTSKSIDWAANTSQSKVENMATEHGRLKAALNSRPADLGYREQLDANQMLW
jgi:hypothetical protein